MTLAELRKKAKEAKMPNYSKATKAQIEEFLFTHSPETPVGEQDHPEVTNIPKKGKSSYNVAIIRRHNGYEVRRYTSELNGKDFIKLAEEFVAKFKDKHYRLELAFQG